MPFSTVCKFFLTWKCDCKAEWVYNKHACYQTYKSVSLDVSKKKQIFNPEKNPQKSKNVLKSKI